MPKTTLDVKIYPHSCRNAIKKIEYNTVYINVSAA